MAWTWIRRVFAPPPPNLRTINREDNWRSYYENLINRKDPCAKPRLSKQNAATLSIILYIKIINFYDKVPYSSKGRWPFFESSSCVGQLPRV